MTRTAVEEVTSAETVSAGPDERKGNTTMVKQQAEGVKEARMKRQATRESGHRTGKQSHGPLQAKMVDRMVAYMPEERVADLSLRDRRRVAERLLQVAAHHEAGHVAVGYYLGTSKPSCVTIAEGAKAASVTKGKATFVNSESSIIRILGGHAAESRFQGKPFIVAGYMATLAPPDADPVSYSDLSSAVLLADRAAGELRAAPDVLCECADRADAIVVMPDVWQRIERFAERLLEHGTIQIGTGCIEEIFDPIWSAGKDDV